MGSGEGALPPLQKSFSILSMKMSTFSAFWVLLSTSPPGSASDCKIQRLNNAAKSFGSQAATDLLRELTSYRECTQFKVSISARYGEKMMRFWVVEVTQGH